MYIQKLITGPGKFGHCFAFRPDEGRWIVVDRSVWGLGVKVVDDGYAMSLIDTIRQNGTLILAKPQTLKAVWFPPLVASCTETVKALLLVNNPLILTPRQLHCALLKSGAQAI